MACVSYGAAAAGWSGWVMSTIQDTSDDGKDQNSEPLLTNPVLGLAFSGVSVSTASLRSECTKACTAGNVEVAERDTE